MQWIRLFLSCLLFESIAGSLAYAVICCRKRFWREENYFLALAVRKAALLMYVIPVTFAYAYFSRVSWNHGNIIYSGDFVLGMCPGMYPVFGILGILWIGGLTAAISRNRQRSAAVSMLLKENRDVRRRDCRKIFLEYQKRFPKAGLSFYQNHSLCSPVSVRRGKRNMILLPDRAYTEKELRILLEHEANHIMAKDLLWRMFGIVILCIHWFNPVVRRQFQDMILYQEIACDLRSSMDRPWYTKKEYSMLLAAQTTADLYPPPISAFAEQEKEIIRRIEIMAKVKKFEPLKKKTLTAGCICLLGISLVPSLAFASTAAELQEAWMNAEAVQIEEEPQDWRDESVEEHGTANDGVREISAAEERVSRSISTFEKTVNGKTRMIFKTVSRSKGDTITLSSQCKDESITYRIGIKNTDTGTLTWVEGQGSMNHTFTIKTGGSYSIYVENRSNQSVYIEASAVY